uniref:Oxidoreductase n=2 Tax=Solanum tuberosum TaxID=4113 RepID=M1A9M3_SOLTU
MNLLPQRFIFRFGFASQTSTFKGNYPCSIPSHGRRKFSATTLSLATPKSGEELLLVVGGGAAGIYGAIRAKTLAPNLKVVVIEKARPLSKVKISGGGRCNVTNGHCPDNKILAEQYPRGHKEFKGSFFHTHGPMDTMSWFSDHGVVLKIEEDGRVFPASDSSSTIIDCLMSEAKRSGVLLQTGKVVTSASSTADGKFAIKLEKRSLDYVEHVEADYLLIASGSSKQVTFPKVKAKLQLEGIQKKIPQLTQVGPMLVTHWGLSGPVVLRLSAWGARYLSSSNYKGTLCVDFTPDLPIEDLKSALTRHKSQFLRQKVLNSYPSELAVVKRFWKYILDREGICGDMLWSSISNNLLISVAALLKDCAFSVKGKGQFKDEFVTAGGVPLSEIYLDMMGSRIHPHLYFAGEVVNVDGITGGFNFQNAWTGGYIAGTSIGNLAVHERVYQ